MGENSREECKTMAKVAEQAERFEDMVTYMRKVAVDFDDKLNEEERNLLSVAYKNVVGSRRTAWRVVNAKCASEKDDTMKDMGLRLKGKIEKEIDDKCTEILKLLDDKLIKSHSDVKEANIFFLKMKGDYYRYRVEICESEGDRKALVEKSKEAYQAAFEALAGEPATSPIKLGLALNFSVFYYEVMGDPIKACEMAQQAFDDAIASLDTASEDVYKDSTLIMQLLRDNLTLWKSEMDEEQQDED